MHEIFKVKPGRINRKIILLLSLFTCTKICAQYVPEGVLYRQGNNMYIAGEKLSYGQQYYVLSKAGGNSSFNWERACAQRKNGVKRIVNGSICVASGAGLVYLCPKVLPGAASTFVLGKALFESNDILASLGVGGLIIGVGGSIVGLALLESAVLNISIGLIKIKRANKKMNDVIKKYNVGLTDKGFSLGVSF